MTILSLSYTADATLVFQQANLDAEEATPTQMATVCVEISGLPTGGLGCDIEVSFQANNGAITSRLSSVYYEKTCLTQKKSNITCMGGYHS